MKDVRLLLLIVLSIATQAYTSLPMLLLLVIVLTIHLLPEYALMCSFGLGLLADFLFGWNLGPHALFYLAASFSLVLYQRKFHTTSTLYALIFSFVLLSVFYLLFWSAFPLKIILLLLLLTVILSGTVPFFLPKNLNKLHY